MLGCEADNASTFSEEHRARKNDEGIRAPSDHGGECPVELVRTLHSNKSKVNPKSPCCVLCLAHHVSHGAFAIRARMPKGSYSRNGGKRLLEQREPLRYEFRTKESQPGDIPARSREAGDEPVSHSIAHNRPNDWNGSGRLLCSTRRERIRCDDQVHPEMDQFVGEGRKAFDHAMGFSVLNHYARAFHVAEVE